MEISLPNSYKPAILLKNSRTQRQSDISQPKIEAYYCSHKICVLVCIARKKIPFTWDNIFAFLLPLNTGLSAITNTHCSKPPFFYFLYQYTINIRACQFLKRSALPRKYILCYTVVRQKFLWNADTNKILKRSIGLQLAMLGMIFPAILFAVLWLISGVRTRKFVKAFSPLQLNIINRKAASCEKCEGLFVTSHAVIVDRFGRLDDGH